MSIVTYVDDRYKERDWKLKAPVAIRKTIDEYFEMPDSGDVLIIHGGQRDGIVTDAGGRLRLVEAVLHACRKGGRAIIFSGGQPIAGAQIVRDALRAEGLVEDKHFLLLTAIQNLENEIDLKSLLGTEITPDWPIREVRRRYAAPMLLTLGILCQTAVLALPGEEMDRDTVALFGGRERLTALRDEYGSGARELLTRQPWLSILGREEPTRIHTMIEQEWPYRAPARGLEAVRELVRVLYDSREDFGGKVLTRAFSELQRALQINQELQQ